MNAPAARVSAADVTFPPAAPASSPQPAAAAAPLDIGSVLDGIRAMLEGCGATNRNDLVVIAIAALIEAGVDTRPRIIGAAMRLGFNAAHAGAVLTATGRGRPRWRRGGDGAYRLLGAI